MNDSEKLSTKAGREKRHDELTATVKDIVDKEKAAQDSKTEKLRKLREAAAAVPPEKNKRGKKRKR